MATLDTKGLKVQLSVFYVISGMVCSYHFFLIKSNHPPTVVILPKLVNTLCIGYVEKVLTYLLSLVSN